MSFSSMKKDELVDLAVRRFLFNDALPPLGSEDYEKMIEAVGRELTKDDIIKKLEKNNTRGFEVVPNEFRKFPNSEIKKPRHGSKHSAGYDLFLPVGTSVSLPKGKNILIFTDVSAYMNEKEFSSMHIRSSLSNKVKLSNQTGIIDKDYYSNEDNYGNIGIALENTSDKSITLKGRVVQIIFKPYLEADNYLTDSEREGGFGSTD